jgi:hypothetical protein
VYCLKVDALIPKYYNDVPRIEARKRRSTYQEIFEQSGGCSEDESPLIGDRINSAGKKYRNRNLAY